MNLKYVKTVYGNRVRIDMDELAIRKKVVRLYNQYGEQLNYERNEKRGCHIHKGLLLFEKEIIPRK